MSCGCGGKRVIKNFHPRLSCPEIVLNVPKTTSNIVQVIGKVTCNQTPLVGVIVTLSSSSNAVSFSTNPVVTNTTGDFVTTANIALDTPSTAITASIVSNGVPVSTTFDYPK